MKALAILLMVGSLGGLIGYILKIPAGTLVGAMAAVILFKVLGHADYAVPRMYVFVVQVLVGVMVGVGYTPQVGGMVLKLIWPILLSTLGIVAAGLALGLIFSRALCFDPVTGYLATSPGGPQRPDTAGRRSQRPADRGGGLSFLPAGLYPSDGAPGPETDPGGGCTLRLTEGQRRLLHTAGKHSMNDHGRFFRDAPAIHLQGSDLRVDPRGPCGLSSFALLTAHYTTKNKAAAELRAKADEYTAFIKDTLVLPLWNYDFETIKAVCHTYLQNELITGIQVRGPEKTDRHQHGQAERASRRWSAAWICSTTACPWAACASL